MSKYRVVVSTSRLLPNIHLGFYLLLVASVWSWRENVIDFQVIVQSGLSVALIVYAVARWFGFRSGGEVHNTHQPSIVMLGCEGQWQSFTPCNAKTGNISPDSLLIGPFLYVVIGDPVTNNRIASDWYCKDQFIEADFRRLCRCIIRARSQFTNNLRS